MDDWTRQSWKSFPALIFYDSITTCFSKHLFSVSIRNSTQGNMNASASSCLSWQELGAEAAGTTTEKNSSNNCSDLDTVWNGAKCAADWPSPVHYCCAASW